MIEKKATHVTLTEFYMGVICLFPLATTLVDGGIINKLLFSLLIGLQLAMLFDRKVKGRTFMMLLLLIVSYIYSFAHTKFPLRNSNLLFYFPFYMVYTYFMCDNSRSVITWFMNRKKYVFGLTVIWTIIVGFSIFLPECYYVKEGGARYFRAFAGSIFRLGPAAVFIQVMAILMQILYGYRKALWFHLVPMYSYFMGSSRTYLIVGLCLLLVSWYFFCKNKKKFYYSLIPMAIGVVLLISVTSMGDKIAYTLDEDQYGDFWFRITSSRSKIWDYTLRYWRLRVSPLSKFLGASLNFNYEITGLWAHNDFIELLGSFGILGIGQYLCSIYILFKTKTKQERMPFVVGFALFLVWLFNAFFNMHYTYFCAMLCYPLVVLGIKYYCSENSRAAAEIEKKAEAEKAEKPATLITEGVMAKRSDRHF